jgi:hypothetical protein
MVIRVNTSINQLHLWYTRLFKEGKQGERYDAPVASIIVTSRFVRPSATMSTPTKENDDAMAENTSTAVDVVAATRVKTPSSVRKVSSFASIHASV